MMSTLFNLQQAAMAVPAVPVSELAPAANLQWSGLILLLPLLSLILCGVCAAMRVRSKLPAVITAASLAGAFVPSLMLYLRYEPPGQ